MNNKAMKGSVRFRVSVNIISIPVLSENNHAWRSHTNNEVKPYNKDNYIYMPCWVYNIN